MSTSTSLHRDSVEIGGEDRRIYYDTTKQEMGLSVSTVTDIRPNPEKKAALKGWRESYDGSDDDSFPHHREQMVYKQLRGTLGHYAILSNLGEVPKGEEEREAEHILKNWDEERPSMNEDGVSHQGDDHAYEGEQAWSKCMRDISWVTNEFVDVADKLGISPSSTILTEEYVNHYDPIYGGQFDLLYEASDGVTTLCDLKLASGLRYDYQLQLAAYRHAILESDEPPFEDIDSIPRVENVRLHPETKVIEVQSNDDERTFRRGPQKVKGVRKARDDGRLEWTNASNLDEMEDYWTVDAHVTPESWDTSIQELTIEFLELVEQASDEWLTQITWDEFMERVES